MVLKGNAIVGQSGGPTAAINATLSGVIRGALENENIDTIFGMYHGIEGILNDSFCNLTEMFDDESKLVTLEKTPAAALGSCRKKLPALDNMSDSDKAVYEKVFDFFKKHNIRYFFYIGGNDSMDTVAKLSAYSKTVDYEMRIMGVPKTIDNDVMGTDHTPGYGSAAKYIAASVAEMLRDCAVYTVKAVTIIEIMGRDAGWLTAAAALTRVTGFEPDLVYLPERVFDYDQFFADVRACLEKHPNVVVCVSEGIRLSDGRYVGEGTQSGVADAFGHKYLSGTGKALELAVKEEIGCKVRSVELNILQRCASHIASLTDITESVAVGRAAVENAVNGVSGKMMTFVRVSDEPYTCVPGYEDIEKIANMVRTVPDSFINERGNGITDEGIKYLLPLIEGESYPEYKNGLPVHISLK
jgi:6-phosphofructokinase 1